MMGGMMDPNLMGGMGGFGYDMGGMGGMVLFACMCVCV